MTTTTTTTLMRERERERGSVAVQEQEQEQEEEEEDERRRRWQTFGGDGKRTHRVVLMVVRSRAMFRFKTIHIDDCARAVRARSLSSTFTLVEALSMLLSTIC